MKDNAELSLLSEILNCYPDGPELLGLLLTPELKPSGYATTPACCRVFAHTGGDGVHFSLADLGELGTPVVMTVPMNFDFENLVVGSDLCDFLALGLRTGYFSLEQLVYDRDTALKDIAECELDGQTREVLDEIQERFDLVPWSNIRTRLELLQIEYANALI